MIFNTHMIKLSFLLLALVALLYGSILLFSPYWFVDFSNAANTNIAWLRNIGAAIIGLLFFGSLSIYYKQKNKLSLLKIITITSLIQTNALIYSRFYNEFSAKNLIVIDLTIFLATFVSIYFVYLITLKRHLFR